MTHLLRGSSSLAQHSMPSKLWLNFSLQLSSPLLSLSLLPWLVWGITVPKGILGHFYLCLHCFSWEGPCSGLTHLSCLACLISSQDCTSLPSSPAPQKLGASGSGHSVGLPWPNTSLLCVKFSPQLNCRLL